jgi:hypothetical protein
MSIDPESRICPGDITAESVRNEAVTASEAIGFVDTLLESRFTAQE